MSSEFIFTLESYTFNCIVIIEKNVYFLMLMDIPLIILTLILKNN